MPTHLGANPRNHVKHYSCSSLENYYYYYCLIDYCLLLLACLALSSYILFTHQVIRRCRSVVCGCGCSLWMLEADIVQPHQIRQTSGII